MPLSKKNLGLVLFSVLTDVLAIIISFLIAYLFRFAAGVIPVRGEAPAFQDYAKVLFVIVPVFIYFFRAYGLYQTRRNIRRIEEVFQVIRACTASIVILMAVSFFYRGLSYSRIYLVLLWILSILVITSARYLLIQMEYRRKIAKKEINRVLLIGVDRNARTIIQWAKNNTHYGQEIIGILTKKAELVGKHLEGIAILGTAEQSESFLESLKPDTLILADSSYTRDRITELVAICDDQSVDFKVAADFYGLMTQSVSVEYISRVPLLGFQALPLDDFWNRLVKRLFDVVATTAIIVATFPIWILALIAIKLDDGGPVFYKQERVGRDGRVFPLLKFRTMKVDAEKETGPVWARKDDDRRTRVGDFFRRWNVDELPQLLNVLAGHMTLVGPRPERPHFVDKFRSEIPRYMARHKIKSGITGWAQVNGYRGNTSIQERIKYDLYYMENWSLLFDIEILFMTFSAYKNAY